MHGAVYRVVCKAKKLMFLAFLHILVHWFDDRYNVISVMYCRHNVYIQCILCVEAVAFESIGAGWTQVEASGPGKEGTNGRWIERRDGGGGGGCAYSWTVKMLEFTGYIHLSFRYCPLRCAYCRLGSRTPTNVPRESLHSTRTVIRESTNLSAIPAYRPAECDAKNSLSSRPITP